MNLERQALVANGLLVIAGVVLTVMATSRQIGLCWTSFMGFSPRLLCDDQLLRLGQRSANTDAEMASQKTLIVVCAVSSGRK